MNAVLPEVFAATTEFTDADLTFLVQTRTDADRLTWMLGHLRTHYPQARVIVRSDGDPDPGLPALAATHAAEFYRDPRLYEFECGGEVCHRWLELFFLRPSRFFFKLDTDTGVHRRFAYLPTHPGLFGSLQGSSRLVSVQGGCIGFSLDAARRLYESRAFLDPSLLEPERSWANDPLLLQLVRSLHKISDDWLVGYAATALGVPMFGFPEVRSEWKTYVPNADRRFAITHPCKDRRL